MELRAQLGHEVVWEMSLPLKLVSTMGVGASIAKLALSVHFEVSTELSFFLGLVLLLEYLTLIGRSENLLFGTSGSFAVFTDVLVHYQVEVAALIGLVIPTARATSSRCGFGVNI